MTMKEIAKLAGVSVSTVSRVINSSSKNAASKEVEDRIWHIIRQTNFIPNPHAKELKCNNLAKEQLHSSVSSKNLVCIFSHSGINDDLFIPIMRAFEQEAYRFGYVLKHVFQTSDLLSPRTYDLIKCSNTSGIAILGDCGIKTFTKLKTCCKKTIITGLNIGDYETDKVMCNQYAIGEMITYHLISLGHQHIGYIGSDDLKLKAYLAHVTKYRLPSPSYVKCIVQSKENGYEATKALLATHPQITSIFCGDDMVAIGAMKAIKESGLSIPKDISIIGVNNIESAQYVTPMLTTVSIPLEDMGVITARLLIDCIENRKRVPITSILPSKLIKRESCRSLK